MHQLSEMNIMDCINPFPNDKFQTLPKWKFADNNFKFDEKRRKFSEWQENTKGKGEITGYEQFFLFLQYFQKTCTVDM